MWAPGDAVIRRVALALLVLLAGCGAPEPTAPPMFVGATCQSVYGWTLELEVGLNGTCEDMRDTLGYEQGAYIARFGYLNTAGWRVRVRAHTLNGGRAGMTYRGDRTIDLSELGRFPHELHHVRLGPAGDDHAGWACDFGPWEQWAGYDATPDEHGYLPPCTH